MFNNLNILFLSMTIISSLISVSSTNWIGIWLGLEFNMISFIPLMIESKNILPNESALKYFIIQASASSLFLFMCILQSIQQSLFWNYNFNFFMQLFLMITLMIKLGAAPFQSWFIMVIQGLNWFKSIILITWQKMAPLFIMNYIYNNNNLILITAAFSSILGSLGGLNQTSLKKIMAFSSINHLGWMLTIIYINMNFLKFYFCIYTMMTSMCIMFLHSSSMFKINQNFSNQQTLIFMISFLSLGGLPPFLGFFPKWIVIQHMIYNNLMIMSIILIMTALITLFFYLQVTFHLLTFNSIKHKWNFLNNQKINNTVYVFSTVTMISLITSNLFFI